MSLKSLISNLKKVTPEVMEKMLLEVAKKHESTLVDLNIKQQLSGKKADGENILPEYAPSTIMYKKLRGQESGHVTLEDEGSFHRYMFAETKRFPIVLDSQDYKTESLVKKYGEIMGLTKESAEEFSKEIAPDAGDSFKKLCRL